MYIPAAQAVRPDPPPRERRDTGGKRSGYGRGSAHAESGPSRDQFQLSDEARLREEYTLRLSRESGAGAGGPSTLAEAARAYARLLDGLNLTFRDDPGGLAKHVTALDDAWNDMLDTLAHRAADSLARREGNAPAANLPALGGILTDAHRRFAAVFRADRPQAGVERAVTSALQAAVKVLAFTNDGYELTLADTMALLYYRRVMENRGQK
ncbi:MAG: hypothetical protein LBT60_06375 [Oscillospiraceae bacterium]|nr:hypothetical protein [Oscillospiraceae bacterium]